MLRPTLPRWEPDSEVPSCRICGRGFNVFNRKHHCRACGRVFCGPCTSNKSQLLRLGYKNPVRVCDICETSLSTTTTDPTRSPIGGQVDEKSIKEWMLLIQDRDKKVYGAKLTKKVRVGIKHSLRSIVWPSLCGATETLSNNPGIYGLYASKSNTEADKAINRDIPRTFPSHPMFARGSDACLALSNVLRAYANFNSSVGYCQGMSYIIATLLMHLNEETAFWVFVEITKRYDVVKIFHDETPACLENFKYCLQKIAPKLSAYLEELEINIEIFVGGWLRTLFTQQFETELVFRLLDIFFVEGMDFLIKIALSMLFYSKETLLNTTPSNVVIVVNKLPEQKWDTDQLIEHSCKIDLKKIENYTINPPRSRKMMMIPDSPQIV